MSAISAIRTPAKAAKAKRLVESELSAGAVARDLGVHSRTVNRWRREGLPQAVQRLLEETE